MSKHILLLVLLVVASASVKSQQTISLKEAIDTAYKNNLEMKGQNLRVSYLEKLKQTGYTIPKTDASAEYGNFNSYYKDTKFGLSQTINFPTVYARQKDLLNEEWKAGILNIGLKQLDLKRQVTEQFYQILYLLEKRKLLLQADTFYAEFLRRAELRFQKG